MPVKPQSNLTLICVLVTIFLDMLGYGIILPVLPQLIGQLSGGSVAQAAVIGGYLVFAYSLMQFLFGPALGNLSDRFGRRPIILIALAGLTIDYTIMGFANSMALIFIGHTIAGISGASVATATAYIADITPKDKRAHRFGLIGAAFGLGFIFGKTIEAVSRQPELRNDIQSIQWLGFALTEATVFYGFIAGLIAFFV